MKTFAIILLAGNSSRFQSDTKKQFFVLKNKPVYLYSIEAFNNSKYIDEIVLVASKDDLAKIKKETSTFDKVKHVVEGGEVRQESVKRGLDVIKDDGFVLIHDAARPLVDDEIISSLIDALKEFDGATPALKVVDTIAKSKDGTIDSFGDRNVFYRIQTPQAFKLKAIKEAHEKFAGKNVSDDTTLLCMLDKKVKLVEGKEKLRKITRLEDVNALQAFIK